jgi:hypothetical protein
MTTPTPAGDPRLGGSRGGGIPLRSLTAWALIALAGTIIFFGFLAWIFPPSPTDFPDRFGVDDFTNLLVIGGPLLAVLIATRLGPVLGSARLIGSLALIEYVVALVLGVLAFLVGLAGRFEGLHEEGVYAFGGVLQALGGVLETVLLLALLALAALWTYRIYTGIGGTLPRLNVQTD